MHLPIHAAGVYHPNSQESLHLYHISSYTPTLGTLVNASSKYALPSKRETKVLLAGVSFPSSWSPLPYADDELNVVRSIFPTGTTKDATITAKGRGVATCNDILSMADDTSILHLVCHGHQDQENVLNSGFVMQDELLTVSKLMTLNLRKAFFAFLSACGTASGDAKQPSQAVNLASTMLFVGFKSVVATMW